MGAVLIADYAAPLVEGVPVRYRKSKGGSESEKGN